MSVGVDVRTLLEIKENPAPGSVHIDMEEVVTKFEEKFPIKESEILVFCESGRRSGRVKEYLETKGYINIKNISSWREWNVLNKK